MCSLAPRLTEHRPRGPRARAHAHRGRRDHRPARRVPRDAPPPAALRERDVRRLRRVRRRSARCTYANDFDFGVSERKAIDRQFANAVPSTFAVEKKGWSPCKSACAVHTSAHGYVALVAAGRFEDAYRVASEPNPFQQRLRPHLHAPLRDRLHARQGRRAHRHRRRSSASSRTTVGRRTLPVQPAPVFHEERVAVVGGGPAGVTAPATSRDLGYKVTVFEAQPVAGGMLRIGIPDYRLPHDGASSARSTRSLRQGHRPQDSGSAPAPTSPSTACSSTATRPSTWRPACRRAPTRRSPGDDPQGVRGRSSCCASSTSAARRQVGKSDRRHRRRRRGARRRAAPPSACSSRPAWSRTSRSSTGAPRSRCRPTSTEVEEGREERAHGRVPRAAARDRRRGRQVASASSCSAASSATPTSRGRRQPVAVEGSEFELEADTVIFAVGQALVDDFLAGLRRPRARARPDLASTATR